MIVLALLPLVLYCAFITVLYFRRAPTVVNGSHDFLLLAWGLFGLISFGPGRLMVPLYVFTAWGIFTWLFWLGFYFVVALTLARQFKNRLVVYHCRRELVLPAFFTLAQRIDPKTEWSGNVLSLHGLGVQWSVTHDRFGGHILFSPTNPSVSNPNGEMLQTQLTNLCQTLETPQSRLRWFWLGITGALSGFVINRFYWDCSLMVQQFCDHWL
jgi:hypothetical protein